MNIKRAAWQPRARTVSWVGFLLVIAYAFAGTLQVLIWNPLAAAPGSTWDEILETIRWSEGTSTIPVVLAWASFGIIFATLGLCLALRWKISAISVAQCFLWLLVLGAPGLMFVSFPVGVGFADTYGISGADLAPWARLLYLLSAAALLILVLLGVRNRREEQKARVTPANPLLRS